ncbi:AMP-binding protein [Alloalcanivorax mobilis]|uniref:AMP-binding protein n=1 Tax=Alloalcanivorax mobilis TaxID=2019569 RepID=UPI000B5B217B|nr:AMP-binding protein [Alloalcanivorax mobilis]ASK33115.1 AMP-dependent synthetase [Alcanivorax sp. N3-2A]ASK36933.1 AMP-dependent synthetase [Alcanivorax sp. N3-2A]
MNLGRLVSRSACYWPDAIAAADARRRVSYRQLDERSNRLANALLGLGLDAGDRVAMYSLNRSELVEVEVALYKAGLVKAPLNARLSLEEALHVLADARARVLVVGPEHAPAVLDQSVDLPEVEHIVVIGEDSDRGYENLLAKGALQGPDVAVADDAPAVLHYTSGSSGRLKAAVQTFGNRMALVRKSLMLPEGRFSRNECVGHVGPVTHASGMQIMPTLATGGCNYLIDRFDIESLFATVEREKLTRFFAVPTMLYRLLDSGLTDKYDLSSLSRITYGAAPMAPPRLREAMDVFGPIFTQGYGAGETTSTISILTLEDHLRALKGDKPELLASCGRPYGESEVIVADDDGNPVATGEAGEILVRGPDVMQGYWGAPDLTAEVISNGWYHTGDVARQDEEGFFFIIDRKKDMIISGGFNIYPAEIEKVLYQHESVAECCVVGAPDQEWGEKIIAFVVCRPDQSITEPALIDYCAQHLAGFKKPRHIRFVEELPKNPNGKVARRLVRDTFWKGQDRQVG